MSDWLRPSTGITVFLLVAWILSSHRRLFPLRTVVGGLILQLLLALLVLRTDIGRDALQAIAEIVNAIITATNAGATFIFGNLTASNPDAWGFVFAAVALPPIIVFSSLSAIGYHLGILQLVVGLMARIMMRLLGVSGAEGLSAAGNVFLGQTEAPMLVRPYIPRMTESELMALMTGGFATIASGVMAAYIIMLAGDDPLRRTEIARHFLTACLMSAPASFVFAKIMVPETGVPETRGTVRVSVPRETRNVIHAAAIGAADGVKLAINVGAMLIAFIALVKLLDMGLLWLGRLSWVNQAAQAAGMAQLDLSNLLGLAFSPVAWMIGVDPAECRLFGGLLGTAMAANEFLSYSTLGQWIAQERVSDRTVMLATYSLCGFANFSSIGIQIGGIGGMAPDRRADLARFGLRAMLAGAMACWMTGCIAGLLT